MRYVDDIFIIYQHNETQLEDFLRCLNNFLPTIKFTVEYEEDGKLPFLDVMVMHDKHDNSFKFRVYRKPIHTENYIHFYSFHSKSIKQNVVINMFLRALKVCDPLYLDQEKTHIFNTFKNLGYPHFFIAHCLRIANRRWYNPQPKHPYSTSNNLSLPYSHKLMSVNKLVNKVNQHTDKGDSINLSFKYNNTLRNKLVRNRCNIQSNDVGVYCIPCLDCDKSYIGESGRGLDVRLAEHKRACRLGNNYSAVATHSLDVGHRISFKQSKIVFNCHDRSRRRTVEGALISLNKTFQNNKGSTKEDKYINSVICESSGLKNFYDISATFRTAASPLYSQVSVMPSGTPDAGAHADQREDATPPEPPDAGHVDIFHRITRSSARRNQQ